MIESILEKSTPQIHVVEVLVQPEREYPIFCVNPWFHPKNLSYLQNESLTD
jgi:hypothetical protein